jgi:hypothetical protein
MEYNPKRARMPMTARDKRMSFQFILEKYGIFIQGGQRGRSL